MLDYMPVNFKLFPEIPSINQILKNIKVNEEDSKLS